MWTTFFVERHQSLHKIFTSGSVNQVRAALSNPIEGELFYGFDCLHPTGAAGKIRDGDAEQGTAYAWACFECLLAICEAIGIVRIENPESTVWMLTPPSPDELISKLDAKYDVEIRFPNPYPREIGLATRRGIASFRAIQALFVAIRVRDLLQGRTAASVLEIGAGVARTAFYARLLGIENYTVVDLPFTGISQGYFLMRTLGSDAVALAGEQTSSTQVKVISPAEFLASVDRYDLVVNIDSFTEIDPEIAAVYWRKIETCADRFWSINHEVNRSRVRDYIDKSFAVKSSTRNPAWLRHGYVDELVSFVPNF
jgi:hypothetical protein